MVTEVLVPKLGMTMTEGTVAEWLAPDGAEVGVGAPVYRLETEKIDFQVEADAAGVLRHVAKAGTVFPPGAIVAYILAPGEELPETVGTGGQTLPATAASVAGRQARPASPAARRLARAAGIDLGTVSGTGPGGRITEGDVVRVREQGSQPVTTGSASPIARRLAGELGLDLARIRGTGPGGRITKEDVESASKVRPLEAGREPATADLVPLTGMRRVIAGRMHSSLQEMAQLTIGMEVRADEVVKMRGQLINKWESEGIRPSYTDLVICAVARALSRHAPLNAEFTDAGIKIKSEIHIGMAVALDNGLVVPVVRNAGELSLRKLASETTRLTNAARDGTLGPDDYAGGTFSVTSLGMVDVDFFTPIINPPNVAILGVGRIRNAVEWDADRPVRASQLTLSLTFDHRAVDGVPAADFLRTVRDLLQEPYRLLS